MGNKYTFSLLYLSLLLFSVCLAEENKKAVSRSQIILGVDDIKKIHKKNLLFIDVRKKKEYIKSHIDQAIHVDIENTFNKYGDITRIAPFYQVQEFLSQAGVRNEDYIVIYDNGDLKNAAHLFWLLETYSHKDVTVLDGGFPEWHKQGGEISATEHTRPISRYIPSISTESFATKLSTRLALQSQNTVILDSRSRREYIGKKSEAKRFGHIPGAINVPWDDNFIASGAKGLLKDRQKLEKLYSLVDKNKEVIAYCNRGKQSAVSYLVLRNLGYKISIYDGGWLEWGNDPVLPVKSAKDKE